MTVNLTFDEHDLQAGVGVCETASGNTSCGTTTDNDKRVSLRHANLRNRTHPQTITSTSSG